MAPFKPFLSAHCHFSWSPELDEAFKASKEAIVEAIRQGVEIFDLQRRTCLRPDWSRRGIGYFLLQQHCSCPSGVPDCCPDGWMITLAGSRFLSSAEQRYAAIEGEALAVAWGLEQTKYFTQGCDNLLVITDHKPLVKIFGDRTLDEISNSRLFRLKQRTLPWRFDIKHLPGKSNYAADATSRHPSPSGSANTISLESSSSPDLVESALMASIRHDAQELGMISWSLIAQETAADTSLGHLLKLIASLWPVCESIYTQEGVLLYQDRVVVPSSLRRQVLQHLHAAHQGTSTMERRARTIARDVKGHSRYQGRMCRLQQERTFTSCHTPLPSTPPSTPFEAVFADFFDYGGRHYLVVGDRLSGWVEVLSSTTGTNLGGSTGLVRHLRSFFATFGVPEELSSDGGPEFQASYTENFLRLWGVRHRLSSVAFPQSNGRAEVAVKTAKRLLMSNTGPTGSLDHDRFLCAMLQLRNTPDPGCNLSPAQIIFGRPLRDTLSFVNRLEKFSNHNIRPLWRQAWAAREEAVRTRITRTTESLKIHSRPLRTLTIGERVFLQNQRGANPTKWDMSGVVVESPGHDQYRVKVDGSGRLTLRNRRFLRTYTQTTPSTQQSPAAVPPPTSSAERQCSPSNLRPEILPPQPEDTLEHTEAAPRETPINEPPPTDNAGPIPIDCNSDQEPSSAPAPAGPDMHPAEASAQPPTHPKRSSRQRRPPRRYEPESGTWAEH